MSDPPPHTVDDRIRMPQHEQSDADPKPIAAAGAALAILIVAMLLFLSWLYRQLETAARRTDRRASLARVSTELKGPELQSHPTADLERFRQAEQQRLTSYSWVDRNEMTVRIPLERAMQLLAERGLPEPRQRLSEGGDGGKP